MYRFAIGELGLKPWEFKAMSRNEYALYAQGYFKKLDKQQQPFRRLYMLIWNLNPGTKGHKILSTESLSAHWPLYEHSKESKNAEQIRKVKWERALELTRKMKKANVRINTESGHQYN